MLLFGEYHKNCYFCGKINVCYNILCLYMRNQKLSNFHFLYSEFSFCFALPLNSQEYKFKALGVEDGLSQITVSDICQDEKSRIWIATLDGLNCLMTAITLKFSIISTTIQSVTVICMSLRW